VTDYSRSLTLDLVAGSYAICRWGPGDSLPPWVMQGEFFSVTRTPAELSAVCDVAVVPSGVKTEGPWRVLSVRGPLDFNITGVLAALAAPLATAGIRSSRFRRTTRTICLCETANWIGQFVLFGKPGTTSQGPAERRTERRSKSHLCSFKN
jgi:hypothetical protein